MSFVTRVPRESIVCLICQVGMIVTWIPRLAKWWTRSTHVLPTPGESGLDIDKAKIISTASTLSEHTSYRTLNTSPAREKFLSDNVIQ